MTTRTCSCGYEQKIIKDDRRKQNSKWRCYSCGLVNKMKVTAIIFILAIGITSAYGYSEQVFIPRGDYLEKNCTISIYSFPQWIFSCDWVFEENLLLPNDTSVVQPLFITEDPRSPFPEQELQSKLDDWIDILIMMHPEVLPPLPVPPEEEKPEVTVPIVELAKCLRGYDRSAAWGAFVDTQIIPYYLEANREQFEQRDNLAKYHIDGAPLLSILKAIEECRAIQVYLDRGMIGPNEADRAIADRLGLDYLGRPQNGTRGNEQPLNPRDLVTKEDLIAEQQRAREFTCTPENQARKLCYPYFSFYGINRGISDPIVSKDVVVNSPTDDNYGKTAVDILSEANRLKAENQLTDEKKAEYMQKMNALTCDTYKDQYRHAVEQPSWLKNACEKRGAY